MRFIEREVELKRSRLEVKYLEKRFEEKEVKQGNVNLGRPVI